MTKDELKEWIIKDVTISGALSINVPDAEIERVIEVETEQLYEIDPDAVKDAYVIVHPNVFHSPEFRSNRTLVFPKCVKSVTDFFEIRRRNMLFGINDGDLTWNRMFMSDIWFGGALNMDLINYRTQQMSVWDQMKAWQLVDIQHS